MFFDADHVNFLICKREENPSDLIQQSEARDLRCGFKRPATKYPCSVCCRKSQRQTVASALRNSYALPWDLIRLTARHYSMKQPYNDFKVTS